MTVSNVLLLWAVESVPTHVICLKKNCLGVIFKAGKNLISVCVSYVGVFQWEQTLDKLWVLFDPFKLGLGCLLIKKNWLFITLA